MAQLRWKEVSSEIAKKNIEVCKEVVREGNLFCLRRKGKRKVAPAKLQVRHIYITSPT